MAVDHDSSYEGGAFSVLDGGEEKAGGSCTVNGEEDSIL